MRQTMTDRCVTALLVGIACGVACAPAGAEDIVSRYTSTATKSCKMTAQSKAGEGDWAVWSCPGVAGLLVRMSEDDLRMTISLGRTLKAAENEPAAAQSFGPFNQVIDTLEWRSRKGGAPFATIQRWMLSDSENEGPNGRPVQLGLLVVTRLPPGPVCHVAYIDVRANTDPNVLARQAADESARTFDCKNKAAVVGQRGRAMELAGR
jgi:hypothetical protein